MTSRGRWRSGRRSGRRGDSLPCGCFFRGSTPPRPRLDPASTPAPPQLDPASTPPRPRLDPASTLRPSAPLSRPAPRPELLPPSCLPGEVLALAAGKLAQLVGKRCTCTGKARGGAPRRRIEAARRGEQRGGPAFAGNGRPQARGRGTAVGSHWEKIPWQQRFSPPYAKRGCSCLVSPGVRPAVRRCRCPCRIGLCAWAHAEGSFEPGFGLLRPCRRWGCVVGLVPGGRPPRWPWASRKRSRASP